MPALPLPMQPVQRLTPPALRLTLLPPTQALLPMQLLKLPVLLPTLPPRLLRHSNPERSFWT